MIVLDPDFDNYDITSVPNTGSFTFAYYNTEEVIGKVEDEVLSYDYFVHGKFKAKRVDDINWVATRQ